MITGAKFSDDKKYRYALWRIWDEQKPLIMFIGLNPSMADKETDDPTIRRIIRFTKDWGEYGGFYMTNLFAWVSSHPRELVLIEDPLGDNDLWLETTANKCKMICFAWGGFRLARNRSEKIIAKFSEAYCLGKTKGGHPRHPLYVAASQKPLLFS